MSRRSAAKAEAQRRRKRSEGGSAAKAEAQRRRKRSEVGQALDKIKFRLKNSSSRDYTSDMKMSVKADRGQRNGIDLSLIEYNLRLSPQERLRRNDRVLSTAEKMRKAMRDKLGG
jgi:hypothetical protein